MALRASLLFGLGAFAVVSLLDANAAHAITATLSAQYFEVDNGTGGPDFGGSGTPVVALGSNLGSNGMPVATGGVSLIDPTTNQLEWWSPSLSGGTVIATGTGTVTLPYSSNMYVPNSTGNNDGSAFETTIFSGSFNLSAPESVEFQLGSDDDSFIYVDGVLIGQNPGIHGVTNVDFTSAVLSAGANTIEVFFADREETGAFLSLNLLTDNVVITPVPEPASLSMLGLSLVGMGLLRRRRALRG